MKKPLPIISVLCYGLLLFACNAVSDQVIGEAVPQVQEVNLMQHITQLSDDRFEGRKPFTAGDTLTVQYLEQEMEKLGLQPGNGDSYLQRVPMVEINGQPDERMTLSGNGQTVELSYISDFVAATRQEVEEITVSSSELVFAGYGIVAPEYNWNDYAGLDVAGKTVLVLVNDPGYATADSTYFKGKAMTYYGRYTYKYEEAARQGATGVIVIHETGPAGYPWGVIETSFTGAHLSLQQANKGASHCALEGWMTTEATQQVMEAAGQDYAAMQAAAAKPGFKAVPLGLSYDLSISNTLTYDASNNVLGLLPGKERRDELIVYTAHWDHLGMNPALEGDQIYNGAMDNASGVAALLGIAEAMKEAPLSRSVLFLAVTGEEQGLLGSAWYAAQPTVPAEQLIANINMDALSPFGPMSDFQIIGYGQSELDGIARKLVEERDRYVLPDQAPEKGYFFRSDHFNFAKIGVPALYGKGGFEHATKGKAYVEELESSYRGRCYHQPCDEIDPAFWDFAGMTQDAQLLLEVGLEVSNMEGLPQWHEGSEFKGILEGR